MFNIDLSTAAKREAAESRLENGVLNHTANAEAKDADATITLNRDTLNKNYPEGRNLKQAQDKGEVNVTGNALPRNWMR